MSTLRDIALRSTGGALGGSVLGAAVAPEGHRLEGAGYGALGGGLAGAGTLAFRGGRPGLPEELAEAAEKAHWGHAGGAPAVRAPDVLKRRAAPNIAAAASSPVNPKFQAEHVPQQGASLADYLESVPAEQFVRGKTAAYAAGLNDAYAAFGLQKEALAPLVGAGIRAVATRALPALARGVSSVMSGGRAAATGIRGAAATAAKAAPRTTAALKGGLEVASHPATQVASMIPTPKPQRLQ